VSRLIRSDWHVHTNLSDCGHPDAEPMAMVRAAQAAGLEAVGLTDHVIFPEDRARPGKLRQVLPTELNGVRIYIGCEADMQTPTRSTIDPEFAAGLDYVMMSGSHLFEPGVEHPAEMDPKTMADVIFGLTEGAIACGYVDIIVHPFGVPMCPYPWAEIIDQVDRGRWFHTAQMAAQAGVAIEFNPRYLKQGPDQARWLFPMVKEAGCKLSISSDSHHPANVGCRGDRYVGEQELRAMGIEEGDLWSVEDRITARR